MNEVQGASSLTFIKLKVIMCDDDPDPGMMKYDNNLLLN